MKKPVFARLLASVTALTFAASSLAQQNGSPGDFELPADQPAQQGRAQGPVIEGIPPPRVARPSPTPAPAPPPVIEVDPGASQVPDPLAAIDAMGQDRPAAVTPRATSAATTDDDERTVAVTEETSDGAVPGPALDLPAATATQAAAANQAQPLTPVGGIAWWMWALALLAVGVLGVIAGWLVRGRRTEVLYLAAPEVERPKVPERATPSLPEEAPQQRVPERAPPPPLPERTGPPAELPKVALTRKQAEMPAPPAPVPASADEDDDEPPEKPLRIALEPARLSVSLLNATLAYRILLTNRGEEPLRDISIDGDMISAHASLTPEEQVAAPNSKLENRHLVRNLAPGETKVVNGEFALPLPLIRPIRKGEATLFVPLARLRVVAGGESTEVLVQTSVVGQRASRPGGGLRPFRLDLGPRIYSELAQRAFA